MTIGRLEEHYDGRLERENALLKKNIGRLVQENVQLKLKVGRLEFQVFNLSNQNKVLKQKVLDLNQTVVDLNQTVADLNLRILNLENAMKKNV